MMPTAHNSFITSEIYENHMLNLLKHIYVEKCNDRTELIHEVLICIYIQIGNLPDPMPLLGRFLFDVEFIHTHIIHRCLAQLIICTRQQNRKLLKINIAGKRIAFIVLKISYIDTPYKSNCVTLSKMVFQNVGVEIDQSIN